MSARLPSTGAARTLEVIRDYDGSTDTCECGKPAVCVGQFEGELLPAVSCDDCCEHINFKECGRCWPVPVKPSDDGGM